MSARQSASGLKFHESEIFAHEDFEIVMSSTQKFLLRKLNRMFIKGVYISLRPDIPLPSQKLH